MELTTENLIDFFKKKVNEADRLDAANKQEVELWWSSIQRCVERMDGAYPELLGKIEFRSHVHYMSEPGLSDFMDQKARTEDLEKAKVNVRKIIVDLETFGYTSPKTATMETRGDQESGHIVIHNQNVSNIAIHLSELNSETQQTIEKLQNELSKKHKNKDLIKALLVKLADTGLDVLEKIFLHSIGV